MAPQVAAYCLERPHGGRGVLLGAARGVPPAKVVIAWERGRRLQCCVDRPQHGRRCHDSRAQRSKVGLPHTLAAYALGMSQTKSQ